MMRLKTKESGRSRDSGVSSLISADMNVFEFNGDSKILDKIDELVRMENEYLGHLKTICDEYKPHFFEAVNPQIPSKIPLYDHPAVFNQHEAVFFYFDRFLEIHTEFKDFLIECDDKPEKIGDLFYHWIVEGRFDLYIQHAAHNPLKHRAVQKDFNSFLRQCIRGKFQLNGFECFRLPLEQLKFYITFLNEFMELIVSSLDHSDSKGIFLAQNHIHNLEKRINELERIHEIRNCDIYLPHLGTYIASNEFIARDYQEGQHQKAVIFLMEKGILLAFIQKGFGKSTFVKGVLEFASFFGLDLIEPDSELNCLRLKDPISKLTTFKIRDKTSFKGKNHIKFFIDRILEMKNIQSMKVLQVNETSNDVTEREAINFGVAKKNIENFASHGPVSNFSSETSSKAIDPKYNSNLGTCTLVEAFNTRAINKYLLITRPEEIDEVNAHRQCKMEQIHKWREWENELWNPTRRAIDRFRILVRRSTLRYKDSSVMEKEKEDSESEKNSDSYDTKL